MANPSVVFLGLRRGGSSISFMILQQILLESNLNCIDLVKEFHVRGTRVTEIPDIDIGNALAGNELVGCFRELPTYLEELDPALIRPILVIRDPRDCQISWFHARYIHQEDALPASAITDAAIYEELSFADTFPQDVSKLFQFAIDRGGLIIRYEDLIQGPIKFISQCVEYAGWEVSREAVDNVSTRTTFIQPIVNAKLHDRSGMPYAALTQLSRELLERMNARYGSLVMEMGYPLWPEELTPIDVSVIAERDAMKRYIGKLAEQNAYRIEEIARQQILISQLQEQNHLRILEIRRLQKAVAGTRHHRKR